MKTLFIEARKKIDLSKIDINRIAQLIPHKIGLLATVQYAHLLKQIKKEFEKKGKIVSIVKSKNLNYPGQILGCDFNAAKLGVEAFLFIGSGRFHALQAALSTNKEIFIWQPKNNKIDKIKKEEIKKLQKKKKSALINFLSTDTVGILVSIKPGQENLKQAIELKKKIEKSGKSDKKAFIFIADIISIEELENFTCKAWINTACPNIIFDSTKIINPDDLYKTERFK